MIEIIVSNIGKVYEGNSSEEARKVYDHYMKNSIEGVGRASHEDVSWLEDGEIVHEHVDHASTLYRQSLRLEKTFPEGIDDPDIFSALLRAPLSEHTIKRDRDKSNYIGGVVEVSVSELMEVNCDGGEDTFFDILSRKLVGTPHLIDMNVKVVGCFGGCKMFFYVFGCLDHIDKIDNVPLEEENGDNTE